jgi:PHD/YefM family antitoxin component YafN of YafNO toxin-antitoxin module
LINGKRASAVLVAEEDWRAIRETLHLLSIPGMSESIRKSLATSLDGCAERAAWWLERNRPSVVYCAGSTA